MKALPGLIVMSHRGWLLMNSFTIRKREVITDSLCTHCERVWNSWTSFQAFCRSISRLFVEGKKEIVWSSASRLWSYKTSYFHVLTVGIKVLLRLHWKEKKNTAPKQSPFGESIKMVTFLIIAQREITARQESWCIYGSFALLQHKATLADFVSSIKWKEISHRYWYAWFMMGVAWLPSQPLTGFYP